MRLMPATPIPGVTFGLSGRTPGGTGLVSSSGINVWNSSWGVYPLMAIEVWFNDAVVAGAEAVVLDVELALFVAAAVVAASVAAVVLSVVVGESVICSRA